MRVGKDTFVRFITFKENECEALEKYLEEKAREGWMINDISCGFFTFKKSEPKKCKFSVDIFTDLKAGEYIDYCEASGWKYICETNQYLIFYTEDENITLIQTDEEIILQKMNKYMIRNLSMYMLSILIIGRSVYNAFFNNNSLNQNYIYGNYFLFLILISVVFIICPVIDLVRSSLWYFKFKKAYKLEENIKYPTLKELKIKMTIIDFYISVFVIVVICSMGDLADWKAYIYTGLVMISIIISISKVIKIIAAEHI